MDKSYIYNKKEEYINVLNKIKISESSYDYFDHRVLLKNLSFDLFNYNNNYIELSLYIFISLAISVLVFFLSFLFANQQYDSEKLSAYECGFQPFEDSRNRFNIKFYLIAILFIVFDLEISYLFSFVIFLNSFSWISFFGVLIFLIILSAGFAYELLKKSLD